MKPKFRAWDKEDKEMLEVHGINFDAQGIWTNEMIDDESDGNFIFLSDVELMEFTGVININKQEIFEGDVVKTKFGKHGRHIGVVKRHDASFYSAGVKQYWLIHEGLNATFEVIGNKFQHPHLLEE